MGPVGRRAPGADRVPRPGEGFETVDEDDERRFAPLPAWKVARTFGAAMAIAPRSMARARLRGVRDGPSDVPFEMKWAPETLTTFEVDRAAPEHARGAPRWGDTRSAR